MRFAFYDINNLFEFKSGYVNTLIIENRPLFLKLLKDIHSSIEGADGLSVLSKNYTPISMQKNAEIISDFVNFDINSKSLISKITSAIEKVSLDESHYMQTMELLGEIENHISLWAFDLPCHVSPSKINVSSILKGVGIEIKDGYEGKFGEAEKILDYMELVREFEREKLFFTINMRSFYDDEIVERFMSTVNSHEFKVMMIENKSYSLLPFEKRFTVDEDLCEF